MIELNKPLINEIVLIATESVQEQILRIPDDMTVRHQLNFEELMKIKRGLKLWRV